MNRSSPPPWDELPKAWRRVAVHEAGHAAIGELCGWRITGVFLTDGVGGLTQFAGPPPAPWIAIAAGAAGHAAEAALYRGVRGVSHSDRREVSALFADAGGGTSAAVSMEGQLAFLFATYGPLRDLVGTAARAVVAAGGKMSGSEFRITASPWLYDTRLRRRVRQFCRAGVLETLADSQDE